MPAVANTPTVNRVETEVDARLADATRRIRTHDLLVGGLAVVAVGLLYLIGMTALDNWLELPDAVRQLGLLACLAAVAGVGYYGLWRPYRRAINPLYAAKVVEETVDDAKNGIVNYVDLRSKGLSEGVRAVVAARAAKQIKESDVEHAGESRTLARLGWFVAGLVVVVGGLFVAFKPVVFLSLLGRAVNPFTPRVIATRTTIDIVTPNGGDTTVTAGQPLVIGVVVDGRIPDPTDPDRLRLQLRYNDADGEPEEVNLERGPSYREWQLRLPDRLIQNGFWYRVAGGDTRTAEHRVNVRPRPLFTAFEAKYEYPPYLRMTPDTTASPHLRGHRGTVVTVTATANRTLRSARAVLTANGLNLPAEVVGEKRDAVRATIPLEESGTYRLFFASTDDEVNSDAPQYDIRVLTDQAPVIVLNAPKDDPVTLPWNDRLAVDAGLADDFGLDTVTLKFQAKAASGVVTALQPRPFLNGKSFRRDADGTFPTALDYKDSIAFTELKDLAGTPLPYSDGLTLEYWLEATDNCTVPPGPNVGKSKVQRVTLSPPQKQPADQQQTRQKAEKRQQQEAQQQQQQADKFRKEDRPKNDAPPKDGQKGEPGEPGEPDAGTGDKPTGENPPQTKKDGDARTKPDEKAEETPGQKAAEKPKKDGPEQQGQTEPKPGGKDATGEKASGEKASDGSTQPTGEGSKAGQPGDKKEELKRKADELNRKLDDLQRPAEGRGADQPPPASKKAPPPEQPPAEKSEPKGGNTADEGEKPPPLGGSAGSEKPGDPNGDSQKDSKTDPKTDPSERPSKDADSRGEGRRSQEKKSASRGSKESGQPSKGDDAKPGMSDDELRQAAKDLTGDDEQKKQAAREKLDREFGKEARQEAEKLADDLKSGDPKRKQAAEDKLRQLQREAERGGSQERRENDARQLNKDELEQAAKDLAGNDEQKKEAARKKLDDAIGQEARQKAEQLADDLQSGDPARQKKAADELQKMQDELQKKKKSSPEGGGENKPKQGEPTGSPMPGDKTDQPKDGQPKDGQPKDGQPKDGLPKEAMPKDGQPKDGQPKDGQSKDQSQDGQPKQDGRPKEGAPRPGESKPGQPMDPAGRDEPKEGEPKTGRPQSGEKPMPGDGAGEKSKDKPMPGSESSDASPKEGGKEGSKEGGKEGSANRPEKAPTPEEIEKLAQKAKDLNSPDEAKRQAAEKELDAKLGQKNREQLQKDLKDNKTPSAEQLEAAKKALEEMAKNGKPGDERGRQDGPGGSPETPSKPLAPNADFAKRAADLNLKRFKDVQANKELMKKLGYTEEELDRFLKDYEKLVAEQKNPTAAPGGPEATDPATPKRNVDTAGRVQQRTDGTKSNPNGNGITNAPPGYSDAQKRFTDGNKADKK